MQIARIRYVSRFFRRRQRQDREVSRAGTHWLDTWLSRISYFSQFGLFVVTIGGLYFTVLPLYQKAILEEAIARKELELAASEKFIEQSYDRLRAFTVKEFVLDASFQCSSLRFPARALRASNEESSPAASSREEIFSINAGACLKEVFQKSKTLKELRPNDLQTLASHIERIVADLTPRQDAALREYQSIPQGAKIDPSILKPLGYFTERLLKIAESHPTARIEVDRFSLAVSETQSAVAHEYDDYVLKQIATLRSTKWEMSR